MTNCKLTTKACVSAIAAAMAAFTVEARSMLYYYDFDTVQNGAIVYQGVNKGTGTRELAIHGSGSPGCAAGGAFDSGHYLNESSSTSFWLGDGSASLGCGTTKGFTLSFWLKTSSSHNAWSDFLAFRVGGVDYRFEYVAKNNNRFTMYYNVASGATNPVTLIGADGTDTDAAPAGVWTPVAIVATPNGTNDIATCALFIGGEKIADVKLNRAGDLQMVFIGSCVRVAPLNNNDRANNTGSTGIDELALFDYPATAEQVKWLAKYKPAQPANGPGRAMPICWLLDTGNDSTGGVQPTNYGTGTDVAYKWDTSYANWVTEGAFGSTRAFHLNNKSTYRVDGASAADGLGASLLSGMTLSFWIKAPATITLWRDFMSLRIGNRYGRFEINGNNPVRVHIYGTPHSAGNDIPLMTNTWQNACMVWNAATSQMNFYIDGKDTGMTWTLSSPTAADVLKSFTVGSKVFNENGGERNMGSLGNTFVDEVAIFNHTFSPAQIQWLTNNVPCLPPLDATNLVRTVSESGAWFDKKATWGVMEWDEEGGAWTDSGRTTLYPSCEDLDVVATVAFADGVTLVNDTFVTPRRLALAAATSAALPVSATIECAEDSRLAPQALEVGEGLQLTMPLYAMNVEGALTLGAGSKITFDTANFNDGGTTDALTAGSFVLPEGETDVLAHFAVTDSRFTLSLSADGKKVLVSADAIAATAVWTGAADGTSIGASDNWECRNISGAVIAGALPCEFTRVIVSSGSVVLNAPAGTTIPWSFLRIEAGSATLAEDADWCGLGEVSVPEGVTIDLNGKALHLNGQLEGDGTITSSVAGGELHVAVPEGMSTTNASVAFKGSLKLVKDGDGTFLAACPNQSYTGGTEVADGTLKLSTNLYPLGAKNASVKICAGAIYDMNGCFSTSSCIYAYNLAGTFRSSTATMSNGWNTNYRILGGTFVVSGDDARLELSNVYFACPDTTPAMFTMNGHTLTFDGTSYVGLGAFRSNDYGKWVFTGGNCNYEWLNGYGPNNVDVEVYAPARFKLKGNADVYGLVYEGTIWEKNSVVSHLLVLGRYVAGPCHLPIQMCDGSTLDLSAITGSFDLTNAVANTAAASSGVIGDMIFKSGTAEAPSTINVNLAGRTDLIAIKNSESPYVVTWPALPENVDFVLDAKSIADGYRIYPEAEGLLLKRFMGFMILVR